MFLDDIGYEFDESELKRSAEQKRRTRYEK